MRCTMLFILLVVTASAARACCVYDTDSLAAEAAGRPLALELISGHREAFPAIYYEARLADAKARIARAQDDLEAYDLASAASRRLGRYPGAISFLTHKLRIMELLSDPATVEPHRASRWRGLALLHLTRWVGARETADLDLAAEYAGKVPDNLLLLKILSWAQSTEVADETRLLRDILGLRLSTDKLGRKDNDQLRRRGLLIAVDGLVGMMNDEPALQTLDFFYALSLAFAVEGRQTLAQYARLRCYELADAGATSLVPGSPAGATLKKMLMPRILTNNTLVAARVLSPKQKGWLQIEFARRRAHAAEVVVARDAFLTAKLASGADSLGNAGFWSKFKPPSAGKVTDSEPNAQAPEAKKKSDAKASPAAAKEPEQKSAAEKPETLSNSIRWPVVGIAIMVLLALLVLSRVARKAK